MDTVYIFAFSYTVLNVLRIDHCILSCAKEAFSYYQENVDDDNDGWRGYGAGDCFDFSQDCGCGAETYEGCTCQNNDTGEGAGRLAFLLDAVSMSIVDEIMSACDVAGEDEEVECLAKALEKPDVKKAMDDFGHDVWREACKMAKLNPADWKGGDMTSEILSDIR